MTQASNNSVSSSEALVERVRAELTRLAVRARADASRVHGGGGFAARRSERLFSRFLRISFLLLFLLPTVFGGMYFLRLASGQFVTESWFTLSSQDSGVRAALSGLLSGQSVDHVAEVMEYLKSANAVLDVDRELDLNKLFSRSEIDVLSRLPADAAMEKKVRYWRRHLILNKKKFSAQVQMRVRAFSPADSMAIQETLLRLAETHINDIGKRQNDQRIREAQIGVDKARAVHREASEALRQIREETQMLDPTSTARGYDEIISKLREDEAILVRRIETLKLEAENSPQLRRLTPQLEVVRRQITDYQNLIAAPTGKTQASIASRAAEIDRRETDVEIARAELATRMAVLESATSEASSQAVFMQRIVQPTQPEKSIWPRRWPSFGVVTIVALMLWGLAVAMGRVVRDNLS